ncbi:MAG: aminotransferase class I/II-fold pyridoxal phosphate-dependent enzyme [Propionibacteriaceae bacterium]|jgi:cystathionine beta-lyase|nr:aminotransferase class I/II-fold pyridoxal phosphate-dependent enzyme [Propionibacteriaceae bacterium]
MTILSLSEAELRARQSLKWQVYPPDVLPMWVAEMDTLVLPEVQDALAHAISIGDTGYPWHNVCVTAFQAQARQRWGWEIDDKSIVSALDVMSNIHFTLLAATNIGDGVIINPPIYPPFRRVIRLLGRQAVEVPLGELPGAEVTAKAWLLCSPHNPTGHIYSPAELEAIVHWCNTHGVQLIVDEIHALLIDPGAVFTPILTVPGAERVIQVTSAGKSWNLAGFKAGLVTGGPHSPITEVSHHVHLQGGHLAYIAHATAIRHGQAWVDELMGEIALNKQLLASELAAKLPEVRYSPAPGTYLAWVDCSALGLENPQKHFAQHAKVAFSPGADYAPSHQQWVRVNLACNPDFVREAVARMSASL